MGRRSMCRYFKLPVDERICGGGFWYAEFEGDRVARQLEVYRDGIFIGGINADKSLVALPDTGLLDVPDTEITWEEFEAVWITHAVGGI